MRSNAIRRDLLEISRWVRLVTAGVLLVCTCAACLANDENDPTSARSDAGRLGATTAKAISTAEGIVRAEFTTYRNAFLRSRMDQRLSAALTAAGLKGLALVEVQLGGATEGEGNNAEVHVVSSPQMWRVAVDVVTGRAYRLFGFGESDFYESASEAGVWDVPSARAAGLARAFVAISVPGRWVDAVETPSQVEESFVLLLSEAGKHCRLLGVKSEFAKYNRKGVFNTVVHGVVASVLPSGDAEVGVSALRYDGIDVVVAEIKLRWPKGQSPEILQQHSQYVFSSKLLKPCKQSSDTNDAAVREDLRGHAQKPPNAKKSEW